MIINHNSNICDLKYLEFVALNVTFKKYFFPFPQYTKHLNKKEFERKCSIRFVSMIYFGKCQPLTYSKQTVPI